MGEGKVQNKTNTGLKKAEALNYVGVSLQMVSVKRAVLPPPHTLFVLQ